MAFDIVVRDRIQSSIVTKLNNITISSTRSVESIRRLRAQLNGLSRNTGLSRINTTFTRLRRNLSRTNKQVASLSNGFARATNASRRLLSGALLLQAADGFVDALDSYQTLQNRLLDVSKVTTDQGLTDQIKSQERLNELTRELFDVATRARVPVSSLAKTYRRLDAALKTVGASQQESMRVTETAGKLLSLSGANAGEAAAALLQLSQAFNKGKLDGDEFRTVAELMPGIIDAIAKRMNITRGAIFDAAKDGKITIGILRGAFADLATQVDKDFSRLPRTVGQAFTELANALTKAFGSSANADSFLSKLIAGIDWIKDNLPTIINLMKAFVGVMALQSIAGFIKGLFTTQGLVNGISVAISALTGYFIYFADQIKVTSTGLATLQDVFVAMYQVLRDKLTKGDGLFGSFFSAEGAQQNFEIIKGFIEGLILGLKRLRSVAQAIYRTWMELDWTQAWTLFAEAFLVAVVQIKDGFLELAKWLLRLLGQLGDVIKLEFKNFLSWFLNTIAGLSSTLPFAFKGVAEFGEGLIRSLRDSISDEPIDFGLQGVLEKWKSDVRDVAPLFHNVFAIEDKDGYDPQGPGIFQQHYRDAFDETEKAFGETWDSILRIAEDNANARIKIEERVREAMAPKPEALRQKKDVLQEQEVDLKVRRIVTKSSSGATGIHFEDREMERLKEFVDELSRKAKEIEAMEKLNLTNLKKQVDDAAESIRAMRSAITEMNRAIANITFDAASLSAETYERTATKVLINIGSKSDDVGKQIGETQSTGWQIATSAVQEYAAIAIKELDKIIDRLNRILALQRALGGTLGFSKGGFAGFSKGGYTGNIGRNRIAGVVHGGEYVMPAKATARYRPLLEAMRSGRSVGTTGSSGSGTTMKVNIENYGSSTHEVQQISANEVRIIAHQAVETGATGVIARELSQPNSLISKSINNNLRSQRRR